jgi:hypothetical protein
MQVGDRVKFTEVSRKWLISYLKMSPNSIFTGTISKRADFDFVVISLDKPVYCNGSRFERLTYHVNDLELISPISWKDGF